MPLADNIYSSNIQPLSTNLAGTQVYVEGMLVGLLFVSPQQINFVLPALPAGTTKVNVDVVTRGQQRGFGVLNVVKALTADVPPLEGGATASASASATAQAEGASPSAAAPGSATPEEKSDESPIPMIAGVVGGIAVLGVLLAFFVRRRRRPAP